MSRIVKDNLWTHIFTFLCIISFFSFPCYFSKSYLYSNLGGDIQRLPWWEHHENTFYWYIFFLMIVLLSTDYVLNIYIVLHHTFYWVKIDDGIISSSWNSLISQLRRDYTESLYDRLLLEIWKISSLLGNC